jgi:hypothetical protein
VVPAGGDLMETAKAFCMTKMGQPTPKICEMPAPAQGSAGSWGDQILLDPLGGLAGPPEGTAIQTFLRESLYALFTLGPCGPQAPALDVDVGAWKVSMAKARPGEPAALAIIACAKGAVRRRATQPPLRVFQCSVAPRRVY